ncbi:MAG: aldehyde dehydrogenase family protein [Burkholderiales bacterium]|nr:MAG: aldehyde dehydrogenase family protein [Burkholderiales bacterium]
MTSELAAHAATLPQAPVFDTPAEQMQAVFDAQLPKALSLRSSTAAQRIAKIKTLREALLAEREAWYAAFAQDMRKSQAEVEATEMLPVLDEMRHAIGRVKSWMKPTRAWPTTTSLGLKARIHYQSRGRVLIIAPWNYPLNLCLGPLVSALAAGNTVILKPSEMTPNVSAVTARIIAKVFDPSEVALFEGAQATSTALLAMPFDHIFFTGSPAVGKIVMTAAAKHLTSVTLELGGKSPTIIDESADLAMAAENLMWGKHLNNGQTCIAPDYVYVHTKVKAEFVAQCLKALDKLFGSEASRSANPDLTRVVNTRHTQRLAGILADARAKGAGILVGGQVDESQNYIAPTLLEGAAADSRIMNEEIFGPLLPIVEFSDINQVIAQINAAPKPLALYIFSKDSERIDQVLSNTSSGGACVNHCMVHYAHGNLPFGGVNNSGIGSGHGHFGFKAFSHERAVLTGGWLRSEKLFAPPYTPKRFAFIRRIVDSLKLPML